jgi:site-specific DNA recombinase
MASSRKLIRCAIYTRKSTEDGLEQEYNSLDAQYDACAAYAQSQRHEGWSVIKERYDDGGLSGGNMHRPALKRLLTDIEAGRVDIILVYKIDRLTRSLSDFAKIVEILDKQEASFVSITQTLNMLLSFAQFEREVTGERIRDKIAASKRKGIWMGGPVPLGYDVIDRKLVVNEGEAQLVRHIMQRYLELNSVPEIVEDLKSKGHHTNIQLMSDGRKRGGCSFTRGNIYHLLSNRIYRGMIVHKGEAFHGEHKAIVSEELWNDVQAKLKERGQGGSSRTSRARTGLLSGLLHDQDGRPMVLTHTQKGNRRFHYYANRYEALGNSAAERVRAEDMEGIVVNELIKLLRCPSKVEGLLEKESYNAAQLNAVIERCEELATSMSEAPDALKHERLHHIINAISFDGANITFTISNQGLLDHIDPGSDLNCSAVNLAVECKGLRLRRGKALRLIVPPSNTNDTSSLRDDKLVALIAEARATIALITANPETSIADLAVANKRCRIRMCKLAKLSCLSPEIVTDIIEGRQPLKLAPRKLLETDLPLCWNAQKRALGFS